jgi:hypothetical protein
VLEFDELLELLLLEELLDELLEELLDELLEELLEELPPPWTFLSSSGFSLRMVLTSSAATTKGALDGRSRPIVRQRADGGPSR